MAVKNKWLTPLQRSYDSIKQTILNRIRTEVPEMSDISEGNIFVIIISIFSAIAEVLHYYIDNMARETFFITARRFSSLYKHAKLVDYHIMAATPANVDVLLYVENANGEVEQFGPDNPLYISGDIEFTSNDGKIWKMAKSVFWGEGTIDGSQDTLYNKTKYCAISLWQKRHIGEYTLGTINANNQIFYLGDSIKTGELYVENSMTLKVGDTPWALVNTFAYSSADDKHYMVDIDLSGKPFVKFGDGKYGMRPPHGELVYVEYDVTYGSASNIPANSFSTVPGEILEKNPNIKILSPNQAVGGNDFETFSQIKDHLPLSIKTLGVIITKEDYISYIKTLPGIDKAYVTYQCGKVLHIYLIADGGVTTEAEALEKLVYDSVDKVKVITTEIDIQWALDAMIYLTLEVTGRKSYKAEDIRTQVLTALIQEYSFENSDINREVRLSDIYSLVDNLNTVDYLQITNLSILKRPVSVGGGNSSPQPNLIIEDFKLTSWQNDGWQKPNDQGPSNTNTERYDGSYIKFMVEVISDSKYEITYIDPTNTISRNKRVGNNYSFNSTQVVTFGPYTYDGKTVATTFNILINSKDQSVGNMYYIEVYNTLNTQLIKAPGISIPILIKDNIKLTINETV